MAGSAIIQTLKHAGLLLMIFAVSANSASVRLEVQVGHSNAVGALALSPDKRFLVTGSDGLITLWDMASQRQLFQVFGDWKEISSFAFKGERVLIGAHEGTRSGQMLDIRSRQVLDKDDAILDICSNASIALTKDKAGHLALRSTNDWGQLLDLYESKTFAPSTAAPRLSCSADGEKVLIPMVGVDGLLHAELWVRKGGTKLAGLGPTDVKIDAMALSPDGSLVAIASGGEGGIHIVNADSGVESASLPGHRFASEAQKKDVELQKQKLGNRAAVSVVQLLEFSPDGSLLASAGTFDAALLVWDLKTKKIVSNFSGPFPVRGLHFSDDGQNLLEGGEYGEVKVWKALSQPADDGVKMAFMLSNLTSEQINSKTPVPPPPGLDEMRVNTIVADLDAPLQPRQVGCLSPNGRYLFEVFDVEDWQIGNMKFPEKLGIAYFDFKTGSSGTWAQLSPALSCSFSADSKTLALGHTNGSVSVWDLERHVKRYESSVGASPVTAVTITPDAAGFVAGLYNGEAWVVELKADKKIKVIPGGPMPVQDALVSGDGRWVMVGRSMEKAQFFAKYLRKVNDFHSTGSLILVDSRMEHAPQAVESTFRSRQTSAFAAHGSSLWFAEGKMIVSLDLTNNSRQVRITETDLIRRMVVSKAGDEVATTTWNGDLSLWDVNSGRRIWGPKFMGDGYVESLYFVPNQKMLLVSLSDGVTQVIRSQDGELMATMALAKGGKWLVADSEGRFDASSFDFGRLMHWISTDNPFKPMPLELFAREYFQPRLLAGILAGSPLPAIPPIANASREQPSLLLAAPKPEPGTEWEVSIPVTVKFPTGGVGDNAAPGEVRIFRNGKLVGSINGREMKLVNGAGNYEFHHIRLPQSDYNVFSAYALGKDGVKSETAYEGYHTCAKMSVDSILLNQAGRSARQTWPEGRRAWLINVGVSASSLPELHLKYAANDAHQIATILGQKLRETAQFEKVTATELVSDEQNREGASKAAIREAFLRLKLRDANEARPDDLVIISFSGHGYADRDGRFYLVPSDAGKSIQSLHGLTEAKRKQLLSDSISSDELSEWLKGIDSDHIVLIIDACQSAASIEGEGFRPGPMGSKGLGQLAYDKGIIVLAATQGDNFALESSEIGQGLLTYALTHDGLEKKATNPRVNGGRITLAEWLRYPVARVPELWRDAVNGHITGSSDTRVLPLLPEDSSGAGGVATAFAGNISEQPMLFDFSNAYNDGLLVVGTADTSASTAIANMASAAPALQRTGAGFDDDAPCSALNWKKLRMTAPDPERWKQPGPQDKPPVDLKILSIVAPVYPDAAKAARVRGTVTLMVTIGADGHAQEVELMQGHPLLVNAAMDAVKQSVWSPPMQKIAAPKLRILVNFGWDTKRGWFADILQPKSGG